jgi:16S rRNA (cytosine1407-C5)-methyltransferase
VIANDSSANRLQALKLNLQNCGAIRQAVTCLPGEQFGFRFPNTFDLVLLDAPCSMEGLRATESHHLKPTTERERWQLSHRQQNLLTSAILAAKPGSQIVYSTCTLAPEEDELVLQAILDEFSGKVSIVHPALPTDINAPAMSVFGDVQFSPEMKQAFRLWPHQFHTAGFFAALLKKTKPFPETSTSHYPSPIPERNWNIVNTKDGSKINELLNALYGFYLDELLTEQQCGLWEHHGMIILVPNGIFEILKGITPLATGLPLGHLIPDGFLPSHEFVSRFHPKFIRGKHILPDRLRAAWMRGEDLRDVLLPFPLRSVVVMIDENGRYLGCCKVLADRAKNLLPKRVVL